VEDSWWTPRQEDLQIEGEEKEYFLELLMREEALEKLTTVGSEAGQPVKKGATRRNKAASSGGTKKGNGKTPKGRNGAAAQPEKKEANAQKGGGRVGGQPGKQARVMAPDPFGNPEAEGGGLQARDRPEARPEVKSVKNLDF
jgi:hypothetical protein